jgi:hypothetical protein
MSLHAAANVTTSDFEMLPKSASDGHISVYKGMTKCSTSLQTSINESKRHVRTDSQRRKNN